MTGLVQGVGFRPHVYRLANILNLGGWITNTPQGVTIEIEGDSRSIAAFIISLEENVPPNAAIHSRKVSALRAIGETDFRILKSHSTGEVVPLILPDIAVCRECLEELHDPTNRRYRYPFINCTHCGPRFSIIQSLPYDRCNTTMSGFQQCPECLLEYENPDDRRFHAQPNACSHCGPQLSFYSGSGFTDQYSEDALLAGAQSIQKGQILAVKGLGGFQLVVDAANEDAVDRLRTRKRRGNKPFAVMFSSIPSIRTATYLSDCEQGLLESSEAPIVLVRKKNHLYNSAAPSNPYLGVFLPYTPLHHLLLDLHPEPLIVTSGNLSEEPLCIDNEEAILRLSNIADTFLLHNRPIERPVDDSVVQEVLGQPQVIRRARGYAPLPMQLDQTIEPTMAYGGHFKNSIAIGKGRQIILSQHIGNLDTSESVRNFKSTISDFEKLYDLPEKLIVTDKHPDYVSTQMAEAVEASKCMKVQHHLAHVFSCMAEHKLSPPLLGISWDGTGYGEDGTIWGGETFRLSHKACQRVSSILPFHLPGGEAAIHDTERVAASLLCAANCETAIKTAHKASVEMISNNINAPLCSSMGRLFDGISAILGICNQANYEAEAAMQLEFEAQKSKCRSRYNYLLLKPTDTDFLMFDWRPMVRDIVKDMSAGITQSDMARQFHNTLNDYLLELVTHFGENRVLLTGGCFQNKLLTELVILNLEEFGFEAFTHHSIPPNDGGLAAGQIYATLFDSHLNPT